MKNYGKLVVATTLALTAVSVGCSKKNSGKSAPVTDVVSEKVIPNKSLIEQFGDTESNFESIESQELLASLQDSIKLLIVKDDLKVSYLFIKDGKEAGEAAYTTPKSAARLGLISDTRAITEFAQEDKVMIKSADPLFKEVLVVVYRGDKAAAGFAFQRVEITTPRYHSRQLSNRFKLIGKTHFEVAQPEVKKEDTANTETQGDQTSNQAIEAVVSDDATQSDETVKTDDAANSDEAVKTEDATKSEEAVNTGDATQSEDTVKTEDAAKSDEAVKTSDAIQSEYSWLREPMIPALIEYLKGNSSDKIINDTPAAPTAKGNQK